GADAFDLKLDMLFASTTETTGREQSDITGLIGQYAHGNEPSHHMAYLYGFINKPWKTEQLVYKILTEFYRNSPDGLIGNEDCGQMSAWYVLSALGMYPVCPGKPEFMLAAPLFPEAKIKVGSIGGIEKIFSIKAEKGSSKNIYIMGRKLNGTDYKKNILSYTDVMDSGELTANLSYQPDYSVYVNADTAYAQTYHNEDIITAPVILSQKNVFRDSASIEIKSYSRDAKIFYTMDSSVPTESSKQYLDSFTVNNSATIKAVAISGAKKSSIITYRFFKLPHPGWKISLTEKYSPQYTAGGDEGIIDGLRGQVDWRKGYWQGYQSQDFKSVIDLGTEQVISKLGAGFLQDVGAWILFPKKIEFELSKDGKKFSQAATIINTISDRDEKIQVKEFWQQIKNQKARYIKVKAINYGKLPQWHLGAGGDAWIFIDEIIIE
ncbi:MAG TPA: glycoside hydrolase domain-containing protein, partial [Bacteroidia bacterium]|nr:glycoside hydrolase domain-containing protein [Bacteroidia bacterium]